MSERIRKVWFCWVPLMLIAACASVPVSVPSGFLGDYSALAPGRGDQVQQVFIDSAADFSAYHRAWVEPTVVWDATAGQDAAPEVLAGLAADFAATLRDELAREFDLVDRAEPGIVHIRTAITRLREHSVSIEIEILDAETGRRLVVALDTHAGEGADRLARARDSFAFWAHRTRIRLVAFRAFDASEAENDAQLQP